MFAATTTDVEEDGVAGVVLLLEGVTKRILFRFLEGVVWLLVLWLLSDVPALVVFECTDASRRFLLLLLVEL